MKKMTAMVHDIILQKGHYHHSVDFTMGNGNDTLLLAQISDRVDAFDIQKEALQRTRQRLRAYDNVTYHLLSHAYASEVIQENIDLAVFNFGFLPGGKEGITTQLSSSAAAVHTACACLNYGGCLLLTLYPGHVQGKEEADYFDAWASGLPADQYHVMKLCMVNKENSPYILWIEKRKKASFADANK